MSPVYTPSPSEGEGEKPQSNWPLVFSAAWLVFWLALAGWCAYELFTAWPYLGHRLLLPLVVACMGVVFRAFDVATTLAGRRVVGWRRWVARLGAVVLGVMLGGWIGSNATIHARDVFLETVKPLIAQVQSRMPKPCPPPEYALDAGLRAYVEGRVVPGRREAVLAHGDGFFLLSFPAGSADIDGSVIYYDSRFSPRYWRFFHNDDTATREAHEKEMQKLVQCKIPLPERR